MPDSFRRPRPQLASLLVAALLAACGGKSHANGGGATNEAGAPSASCPSQQPAAGESCSYAGPQCNYDIDRCSSVGFACMAGRWAEVPHTDGAAYTCSSFGPGAIPEDGASCDCLGQLDCSIDDCSDQGKVHAVCDNSTWHVTHEPCIDRPCGTADLKCKTNELCVAPRGLGGSYSCQKNPCAELLETSSCECAGSLCGAARCVLTDENLDCVCDTC